MNPNSSRISRLTFPIRTNFAFLKLSPSFSYSGASFLQCPHLPQDTKHKIICASIKQPQTAQPAVMASWRAAWKLNWWNGNRKVNLKPLGKGTHFSVNNIYGNTSSTCPIKKRNLLKTGASASLNNKSIVQGRNQKERSINHMIY